MTMLGDFTLTYAWNAFWQVPLFCAAGWLAAWLVRDLGPVLRHRVSVAVLLLAAIVPGLPSHPLHALAAFPLWPWSRDVGGSARILTTLANLQPNGPRGFEALPTSFLHLLAATYLASFAFAAVRFFRGLWKLRRLVQGSLPVQLEAGRQEAFGRLLQIFRLQEILLRTSDEISGPTALWMRAPMLLLPSRFVQEGAFDDLMAALAHECAHLQRRDFALQLFYTACTLPIAMHPLTAMLRRRVAESREMLCDALAAQSLTGGDDYAAALLRIAVLLPTLHPATNLHAIGLLDAHSFERRIMNILHRQRSRSRMSRFGSILAATVLGVVTCASALALHARVVTGRAAARTEQAATTKPEIVYRKAPVYPAEARAEKNILNGTVTLAVDVNADGKPTSVRVAKSLRTDYDQSAVDAVTEWRFNSAMENGKPVAASTSININYMIEP